jgi:putative membrane-bound dehydrogenase-like protein
MPDPKRFNWFAALGLLFLFVITDRVSEAQNPEPAKLDYQVGVAAVDVTPAYPVRLNGFGGRREEAAGTSQRLWAKALAISHGTDAPVVIITLDSLGVREWLVEQVAAELNQRYQLPRENLVLTFTHTHSAPKVNGSSDTIFSTPIPAEHQEHIDRYTSELPGLIVAAASEAIEQRRPASLAWTVGKVGFAVNRRTAGGPVDHDLPLLVACDKAGRPFAFYTTYACHCVTLSFNQYSGDWAGYAQELIEREFPRATALVSIGCGSDSNPSSGVTGDNVAAAAAQGGEIVAEVKRLLGEPLRPLSGPLKTKLDHLQLPLNPLPTRSDLEAQVAAGGPAGYNASWQLAKLDRGEPLLSELRYPIQSLRFGDQLQMTFLAGEVCVDYALRLKRELNRDRVWLHGYSNDFGAYIPSERLLKEGGYGGGGEIAYFALPTTLAAGLEDRIVAAVKAQTPEEFLTPPGTQGIPPKSPEESLATLRTHPELEIQLVAAEPLVEDPVALDFGPDGRLWVAEMPDYGRGVNEDFLGQGRVKFLEDTNGDGRADRAVVFLEGLRFPTDVKVWRDGVLVCDAPEILFAADRDGDGKAEVREVVTSGFATHNPHARVNSLRWGLDGYVYGSGGLFGGQLRSGSNEPGQLVDTSNRDFRLASDTLQASAATGQTQQGRTRDDYGNWFGCNNSVLLMHYPVEYRFTERNAGLTPPTLVEQVASESHGQQLFPAENLVLFQLSGAPGRPTSACSAEIYRDQKLGKDFYGDAFVCEPVNQLVHRMKLTREGISFRGDRAESEQRSEFLTSTDNWFRPVQVRTGPDGALYVVDMYRYVIEHGQWIPKVTKAELDIFAGQRLGRIYRIVPRNDPSLRLPVLSGLSEIELVAELRSSNGARRDLAQQLLTWREQLAAETWEAIVGLMQREQNPAVQLQAFSAARALASKAKRRLTAEHVLPLLEAKSSEVRAGLLRIIAEHPEEWAFSGELARRIVEAARDSQAAVQLQACYLLAQLDGQISSPVLVEILARSDSSAALQYAALGCINAGNAAQLWSAATSRANFPADGRWLERLLPTVLPFSEREVAAAALQFVQRQFAETAETDDAQGTAQRIACGPLLGELFAASNALAARSVQLFDREQTDLFKMLLKEQTESLLTLAETTEEQSADSWRSGLRFARELLRDESSDFLSQKERDLLRSFLLTGFQPARSPETQLLALQTLLVDPSGWELAIQRWESLTPLLRRELLELALNRRGLTQMLLAALESGTLTKDDLDAAQRGRLLADERTEVREKAEQLLQRVVVSDRAALLKTWETAVSLSGDFERGRAVFRKHCAACHRLDGAGYEVGPDLAALTNRTPAALLVATIDPNRDVESRYLGYSALTRDGVTLTGMLTGETASSLTLKEPEGKEHVLLRSELEELRATRKSIMPEGLEQELQPQDFADVFSYLGPARAPRRMFEGNQPVVVRPSESGVVDCSAKTAEIFGEAIIYESTSPFRNIGFWQGDRDHAVWTVDLPQEGAYDVYLDYACNPDTAGNGFVVVGPSGELSGTAESTGAWSEYRWKKVGELQFPSGQQRLTIGFSGPRRGPALMDLRTLVLVPAGTKWPAN